MPRKGKNHNLTVMELFAIAGGGEGGGGGDRGQSIERIFLFKQHNHCRFV